MTGIFKRIDTVFLKVNDFEKAIEWYSHVLGFDVRWRDDQGGYAALNIGETPLTLVRSDREKVESPTVYFNFYTENIEEAHKHLTENGVVVGPIEEDINVKWFKFKDLEGNELEVCCF
ncbi:VOC family protein [Cytobacillus sp. FJAT-54145]|uniref:VOC family protein n=1 Tax=Cytobacillus spartinae TaxID=3299023 RepID=A0ABW6KGR3_9BACI